MRFGKFVFLILVIGIKVYSRDISEYLTIYKQKIPGAEVFSFNIEGAIFDQYGEIVKDSLILVVTEYYPYCDFNLRELEIEDTIVINNGKFNLKFTKIIRLWYYLNNDKFLETSGYFPLGNNDVNNFVINVRRIRFSPMHEANGSGVVKLKYSYSGKNESVNFNQSYLPFDRKKNEIMEYDSISYPTNKGLATIKIDSGYVLASNFILSYKGNINNFKVNRKDLVIHGTDINPVKFFPISPKDTSIKDFITQDEAPELERNKWTDTLSLFPLNNEIQLKYFYLFFPKTNRFAKAMVNDKVVYNVDSLCADLIFRLAVNRNKGDRKLATKN